MIFNSIQCSCDLYRMKYECVKMCWRYTTTLVAVANTIVATANNSDKQFTALWFENRFRETFVSLAQRIGIHVHTREKFVGCFHCPESLEWETFYCINNICSVQFPIYIFNVACFMRFEESCLISACWLTICPWSCLK